MNNAVMYKRKSKARRIYEKVREAAVQIPKEHRGFGKQTFMLAKEDLIKTYKGALIGPVWAIMKPLFQLFVYWFAFTIGLNQGGRKEQGVLFFTFLMVGFIPWFFMSEMISRGSKSIADNRQFVNKVSFPVSVIMTYTSLSKFYVHILLFSLGYVFLTISGYYPNIYNLQLLIIAPMMFFFFLALLWSIAPMSAFSKDFSNFINTIMSGLFWLSGVTYDSYQVGSDWIRYVLLFNPITYFSNAYRKALITNCWLWEAPVYKVHEGHVPQPMHPLWENGFFLIEFAVVIIIGAYNYNRLRKELPDVL